METNVQHNILNIFKRPLWGNINKENMVIFYKTLKKCNVIQLTKNKKLL